MSAHVFVDETKARGYVLAAAVVLPDDLAALRKLVNSLRLPRQRRIHFQSENDARRKVILNALISANVCVTIYDASSHPDVRQARDAAMTRLVDDIARIGAAMLVVETDDQALASDRAIIRSRAEMAGCLETLRYAHMRAFEEPLLAIPDAVAWSWAKAGTWRRHAGRLISAEIRV